MKHFKVFLRDMNIELVAAWQRHFEDIRHVEARDGDIIDISADAIVSPANSFGYMDGGIDRLYLHRFGWDLQTRLQTHLRNEHDGELPVGQAVLIETGDTAIPYLVSAPTMRVPMDVSGTVNAYLAFRATLRAIKQHNAKGGRPIRSVLSPGLCTAIGRMAPEIAA